MEGPARGGGPRILGRAGNSRDLGSRSDSLTCQFQKGRLETLGLNCSPLLQNVSVTENLTSAHYSEDMTPCGRRVTQNISAGTFECWEQVGNINANPMLTSILINFHKFWNFHRWRKATLLKAQLKKKKSMKGLKSKIYDRQPSSFIRGVKNRWCSELCFTLQAKAELPSDLRPSLPQSNLSLA